MCSSLNTRARHGAVAVAEVEAAVNVAVVIFTRLLLTHIPPSIMAHHKALPRALQLGITPRIPALI